MTKPTKPLKAEDLTEDMVNAFHRRYFGFDLAPWQTEYVLAALKGAHPIRLMRIGGQHRGRNHVAKVIRRLNEILGDE